MFGQQVPYFPEDNAWLIIVWPKCNHPNIFRLAAKKKREKVINGRLREAAINVQQFYWKNHPKWCKFRLYQKWRLGDCGNFRIFWKNLELGFKETTTLLKVRLVKLALFSSSEGKIRFKRYIS
jgi:hypothetical protein